MADEVPAKVIKMLRGVPLLSACTAKELRTIGNLGTVVNVAEGARLTRQGSVGREFFLLLDGEAGCFVDDRRVATFQPGDFFGEMALLDRGPRHATVIVEHAGRVLVLDGREFSRLLDASPSISRKLLSALAQRERMNASIRS